SAVSRIWKAIQSLDGGNAAETATTAPKRANKAKAAAKKGKKAKNAAKAKPAKAAKAKRAKGGDKPAAARDGSKKATVLGLLQRKGGATLTQIGRGGHILMGTFALHARSDIFRRFGEREIGGRR